MLQNCIVTCTYLIAIWTYDRGGKGGKLDHHQQQHQDSLHGADSVCTDQLSGAGGAAVTSGLAERDATERSGRQPDPCMYSRPKLQRQQVTWPVWGGASLTQIHERNNTQVMNRLIRYVKQTKVLTRELLEMAGNQRFTWVTWGKTFDCFIYQIYLL